jgi:hypothetical protein
MVAIYIAGFVILFALATVVYKVCASLAMKDRTRISAAKLAPASPDEPLIVLGSSRHLSRSDLVMENLALRQELSVLRAQRPQPRPETPDNGSGLASVPVAQLEAFPDHRRTGNALALARFRGQEGDSDCGITVTNNSPPTDGEGTC